MGIRGLWISKRRESGMLLFLGNILRTPDFKSQFLVGFAREGLAHFSLPNEEADAPREIARVRNGS